MPSPRSSKKQEEEESPYKSKLGPLYYNPMMGWYTAAALSGMLVIFLLCLALDKAKTRVLQVATRAADEARKSVVSQRQLTLFRERISQLN